MVTLKDAPKALFRRVSRTLTRRYEELAASGKLSRVQPLELQIVRVTVELCEWCMGNDIDALEKWTFADGVEIERLPPYSLEEYLTAPLEPSLGSDMEVQIIYIAGRIVYSAVSRKFAETVGVDPDDDKQMYAKADSLLEATEEKLISAGLVKVVDKDILATMFQMARACFQNEKG